MELVYWPWLLYYSKVVVTKNNSRRARLSNQISRGRHKRPRFFLKEIIMNKNYNAAKKQINCIKISGIDNYFLYLYRIAVNKTNLLIDSLEIKKERIACQNAKETIESLMSLSKQLESNIKGIHQAMIINGFEMEDIEK
jgi:hypothetical protein